MGYFIDNTIAAEKQTPAGVSLSNNNNFIEFESLPHTDSYTDVSIVVHKPANILDFDIDYLTFDIVEEKTGITHTFSATTDIASVTGNIFYIGSLVPSPVPGYSDWTVEDTAESLRSAFLRNPFLGNNFEISLPPVTNPDNTLSRGKTIKIKSKGTGIDYSFEIEKNLEDPDFFFDFTGNTHSTSRDTISSGLDASIEIDIFRDTGVFPGVNDTPDESNTGTLVTTLSKSYYNTSVWFNVNIITPGYYLDLSNAGTWFNPQTVSDYRFTARRIISDTSRYRNTLFYYSNVLYVLNGYDRDLEINNMSDYVYNTVSNNRVKPLTKQPALTHIKGQKQYFNFTLADPDRNIDLGSSEYTIGITYRLYTQSKNHIADVTAHEKNRKLFSIANTILLDMDGAIGDFEHVGYVEVFLSRSGAQISEPLTFYILPECLYKVNDFAFLNSLGGWSSFNFSGTQTTDFKASANTIYKTQTPEYTISSEIESINNKETEEQFTAETMPVNKTVCDWLKELSSSVAVYELSTKRYVIVDELNIKPNTKDDLFRLEMKYHYSDRYNTLFV